MIVGYLGNGELYIEDGGTVNSSFFNLGLGFGNNAIGSESGSNGNVVVTGDQSTWNVDDHLIIGGRNLTTIGGTGILTVENQGFVGVTGTTKTWDEGTVMIDGGTLSTRFFDRRLGTFIHHDGTLRINGGTYTQNAGALFVSGDTSTQIPRFELVGGALANNFNGTLAVVVGSLDDRSRLAVGEQL